MPNRQLELRLSVDIQHKLSFFDHLQKNPEALKDFNIFMTANRSTRKHWIERFPVETQILSGADDGVLMVDVGGDRA